MAQQITVNSASGNVQVTISRAVISTVANIGNANVAVYAHHVLDSTQSNITSVGNLTSLNMSGSIVPTANITYDLGTPTHRFRDLYLANNSIYIGNSAINSQGNNTLL